MKKKMNYPKKIVSKIRQHIEETNRQSTNLKNVWDQWQQFDKWDQGSEWIEVSAPTQKR